MVIRKVVAAALVTLLIPIAMVSSASAYNQRVKADSPSWQPLSQNIQVWILGKQVSVYKCIARPSASTLSWGATANNLSETVSATVSRDSQLCPSSALPYAAKYLFTPTFAGKDFPGGSQAKLLVYQITIDNITTQFAAAAYSDSGELNSDEVDGKAPGQSSGEESDQQQQQAQVLATPKPAKSPAKPKASPASLDAATASRTAISGWNGCSFNGTPMFGRVRLVLNGGQFKIKLVKSGAVLKVNDPSPRAAKKCGEWQFVQVKANFTVQLVKSGQDFTVSLGADRPGLKN
jgi:hypothetical protein